MRVLINSFFSQQNKISNRFLLTTDGNTKIACFVAERMREEFGASVTFVVPRQELCEDSLSIWAYDNKIRLLPTFVPYSNLHQRIHVNTVDLSYAVNDADLVITFNEFGAFPMRALNPKLKIVQWNSLPPEYPWPWMAPGFFPHWLSADLIACQSQGQALEIRRLSSQHVFGLREFQVWPFSFRKSTFDGVDHREDVRDIDLLFVQRCTTVNSSHHREFIQALMMMRECGWRGKVAFTDVTHYVRMSGIAEGLGVEFFEHSDSQIEYAHFLRRAKNVIALRSSEANLYGGMAFRDAVYSGACPIVLGTPEYQEIVGHTWPYQIYDLDPVNMAKQLEQWVRPDESTIWRELGHAIRRRIIENVERESFENTWDKKAKPAILRLVQ